jgi:hypothetical protein
MRAHVSTDSGMPSNTECRMPNQKPDHTTHNWMLDAGCIWLYIYRQIVSSLGFRNAIKRIYIKNMHALTPVAYAHGAR